MVTYSITITCSLYISLSQSSEIVLQSYTDKNWLFRKGLGIWRVKKKIKSHRKCSYHWRFKNCLQKFLLKYGCRDIQAVWFATVFVLKIVFHLVQYHPKRPHEGAPLYGGKKCLKISLGWGIRNIKFLLYFFRSWKQQYTIWN